MMTRLQRLYREEAVPKMKEKFGLKSCMAIPRLEKIVVSMGVGKAIGDMKILESAMKDLAMITGQQPMMTRAKEAISNFKLKEGAPIGCKVTLRRVKMFEFMDRFVNICLPRIRDFNGVPTRSFDKQGNFTVGISEQAIFPEVDTGRLQYAQGMDITFVFNKGPKEQTAEILRLLGMPFSKR